MGNNIMFIALAVILGVGTVAYVGQRTLFESNKEQAEYQEQGLARDVAKSGLDRTISEIKRKMMNVDSSAEGVDVGGGRYDADVSPNLYGDLDIRIDAGIGDNQNIVDANVIFEAPMDAAIVLTGERVNATGSGNYTISGLDRRAPSRASSKGFLSPTTAIATNGTENLRRIAKGLSKERVIGAAGQGSWDGESSDDKYEALYGEALLQTSYVTLGGSEGGSYGSADNPAIVRVVGDFNPTSSFSGSGLLIVEDGHFNVGDDFNWEGMVLVRKNLRDSINISLGSGSAIYGSLIGYDLGGFIPVEEECVDVPFEIEDISTVPGVDVNLEFKVLGAAISYGGSYDMPVTARLHLGSDHHDPFGSFNKALSGNVNTDDPVDPWVPGFTVTAGTPITISGRSWKRNRRRSGTRNSHWSSYLTQISTSGGNQLIVLRDGDKVPNIQGYLGQSSVEDFVADYIDEKGRITLNPNQSIYLFELGSTNPGSAAFDMQDLVVLVTMSATGTTTECTAASVDPVLNFNIADDAEVHYSPEAVAKLGKKLESIRSISKVVVTEHRSRTVTPEERAVEEGGGQYGGGEGGGEGIETVEGQ